MLPYKALSNLPCVAVADVEPILLVAPQPFDILASKPSSARASPALPPPTTLTNGHPYNNGKSDVDIDLDIDTPAHDPLLNRRSPKPKSPRPPSFDSSEDLSDVEDIIGKHEPSKSTGYLILLTLGLGGLSIAWAVELSYLSPFLLSLGLSKAVLALVWIAGPLSGTLVQPYVGLKSDNCRIPRGRRRPFILGGAAATIVSLLFLAWCIEIVGGVMSVFGNAWDSSATIFTTQVFAVLFVYILDFAINVIQASLRAFIVDCAPSHQQNDANAWASRVGGLANIIGYLSGYVYLPQYLPLFGNTQFKVLVILTCLVLTLTVGISVLSIHERDPRTFGEPSKGGAGLFGFFTSLYQSVRRLPKQISRICQVQLAAWIGWFPVLFYITTYIAEIYSDPFFEADPNLSDDEINSILETGTRLGTVALFVFSIATFVSSIILPIIIAPSSKPYETPKSIPLTATGNGPRPARYNEPPLSTSNSSIIHTTIATLRIYCTYLQQHLRLSRLQIKWLTLRRAWMLSHVAFTILMFSTFFVRGIRTATVLVGFIGIPWALTNWAPFALIAAEISKRDAIRRRQRQRVGVRPPNGGYGDDHELENGDDDDGASDQAGVVLGIHNVAIAAPQVIATLVSSVIFKALQKPRGVPGDDSVAWVLRFGGLCAILAAWLTTRVGEGDDEDDGGGGGGGGGERARRWMGGGGH